LRLNFLLKKLSEINSKYEDEYNELCIKESYQFMLKKFTKNINSQDNFVLIIIIVVLIVLFIWNII